MLIGLFGAKTCGKMLKLKASVHALKLRDLEDFIDYFITIMCMGAVPGFLFGRR
jgi:hypothetical protein